MFKTLIDKIFFNGYEAADAASTEAIVARYSRGNTSVQLRRYLNADKLKKLLSDGDNSARRLAKRAQKAKL